MRVKPYIALAITLAGVLSVSVLLTGTTYRAERAQRRAEFHRRAHAQVELVHDELKRIEAELDALYRLLEASPALDRQRFRTFVGADGGHEQFPLTFAWAPRVRRDARRAFERSVEHPDGEAFYIRHVASDGALVRASPREEYFPLLYAYPSVDRARVLGLDLASLPTRARAMRQAISRGGAATTGYVSPSYENGRNGGRLALRAVYTGGKEPASQELRRQRLKGYVLTAFQEKAVLAAALGDSRGDKGVAVSLSSHLPDSPDSTTLAAEASIEALGEQWRVRCTATDEFWVDHTPWSVIGVILGCLLCGSLISAFVISSAKRQRHTTELVRRRTAELRASERRFKDIADCASDWFWEVDEESRFTYCSNNTHLVLGFEPHELIGRRPFDFMPPGEAERVQAEFDQIAAQGRPFKDLENWIVSRGGQSTCHSTSGVPIRDDHGRLRGYRGVARDITDRKRYLDQLEHTNDELTRVNRELKEAIGREKELAEAAASANRAKTAFLANMSHEIRTPMNGVVGMAELLVEEIDDPKHQEHARTIVNSAESLLVLLDELLDFSKIEAGKIELDQVDFDPRQMLSDTLTLLDHKAQSKGLSLRMEIHPDVPATLRGDPARLRQVFTNLVGNAIKFTDEGEVAVAMSVGRESAKGVVIQANVRDTGIGIARESRAGLFEPFNQADVSTTRQFGGTGLGLSICKQLVEMMGGRIGVESEPGRGSTFWFTVCLRCGAAGAPKSQPERGRAEGGRDHRGLRVLLAEDNPVNQKVARAMLARLAVSVDTAEDGLEALEALARAHYDVVLMDCQMPRMDGYEAVRRLRRGEHGVLDPDVPVVALTAHALPGDRARCLDVGMNDHLAKPLRIDDLEEALHQAMMQRKNPDEEVPQPANR